MLVLVRKFGQKIYLAKGTIEIQIVDIRHDLVRIGITAPDDIDIVRDDARCTERIRHGKVEK